jgi:hypothetical protein
MRIENNRFVSLEEDIENIWSLHGWEVVKEEVGREGDLEYWKIYAKRKGGE